MGHLLESMSPEKVNGQRGVVQNERRQSYENRPYGMAFIRLGEALFPPEHPYHWPTIGSMEDLEAASFEDVVEFFRTYYGPNNTSLVIAGDIDPAEVRAQVEKWFSDVPAGPTVDPVTAPPVTLRSEKRLVLEDKVQLPRMYMCWLSPAQFRPGDAAMDVLASVLTGGKNSRLYKRLVYDLQIAQDVSAFQWSRALASVFCVTSTAREGHPLAELEKVVQEEIDRLKAAPPLAREIERAVNQIEVDFLRQLEKVGGFGGKADKLNQYFTLTGNPDYFSQDLGRYRNMKASDVQAASRGVLRDDARVVLSIVPEGKPELAAGESATEGTSGEDA